MTSKINSYYSKVKNLSVWNKDHIKLLALIETQYLKIVKSTQVESSSIKFLIPF